MAVSRGSWFFFIFTFFIRCRFQLSLPTANTFSRLRKLDYLSSIFLDFSSFFLLLPSSLVLPALFYNRLACCSNFFLSFSQKTYSNVALLLVLALKFADSVLFGRHFEMCIMLLLVRSDRLRVTLSLSPMRLGSKWIRSS